VLKAVLEEAGEVAENSAEVAAGSGSLIVMLRIGLYCRLELSSCRSEMIL